MRHVPCPVQAGDVIAGRYRVDRVLGVGGMGVVVSATQLELERVVALKFMQESILDDPEFVRRFSREARAAAKLQSEHVVRVLDFGALDDGIPYIVMEYLEGEDLAKAMAARGPLGCPQVVDIAVQVCEALFEAHSIGIVHRDLKPANLFLAKRPTGPAVVKVLDFGLSKIDRPEEGRVTSASNIFGSPMYMSPEQIWSSKAADARSDVWSLGVVVYELLTGQPPFAGESGPELLAAILHRAPRPFDGGGPGVPPEVRAAICRCLEKDPALRFAGVRELAGAIAPFGSELARRLVEQMGTEGTVGTVDELPTATPESVPSLSAVERSESLSGPAARPTPSAGRRLGGSTVRASQTAVQSRGRSRAVVPAAALAVASIATFATIVARLNPRPTHGSDAVESEGVAGTPPLPRPTPEPVGTHDTAPTELQALSPTARPPAVPISAANHAGMHSSVLPKPPVDRRGPATPSQDVPPADRETAVRASGFDASAPLNGPLPGGALRRLQPM